MRDDVVLVEVQCPHTVGLCYQNRTTKWLMNLPCPCNDPSVVLREVTSPAEIEAFLEGR